jgi:hypothetical protein
MLRALVGLLAAACGSTGASTSAALGSATASGTVTTSTPTCAVLPPELQGTYTRTAARNSLTIHVELDLHACDYSASDDHSGGPLVRQETGDIVWSGSAAAGQIAMHGNGCRDIDRSGTSRADLYSFTFDGHHLTLTAIDDTCIPRVADFSAGGGPFVKG